MANNLQSFVKSKDFLVCIDSDGCAIDSMNIKHINCFGPCMVEEWDLHAWKNEILEKWNCVNLYSLTRGINRFKGLLTALKEINEKYYRALDCKRDHCQRLGRCLHDRPRQPVRPRVCK